jgi:hypothetical protein
MTYVLLNSYVIKLCSILLSLSLISKIVQNHFVLIHSTLFHCRMVGSELFFEKVVIRGRRNCRMICGWRVILIFFRTSVSSLSPKATTNLAAVASLCQSLTVKTMRHCMTSGLDELLRYSYSHQLRLSSWKYSWFRPHIQLGGWLLLTVQCSLCIKLSKFARCKWLECFLMLLKKALIGMYSKFSFNVSGSSFYNEELYNQLRNCRKDNIQEENEILWGLAWSPSWKINHLLRTKNERMIKDIDFGVSREMHAVPRRCAGAIIVALHQLSSCSMKRCVSLRDKTIVGLFTAYLGVCRTVGLLYKTGFGILHKVHINATDSNPSKSTIVPSRREYFGMGHFTICLC